MQNLTKRSTSAPASRRSRTLRRRGRTSALPDPPAPEQTGRIRQAATAHIVAAAERVFAEAGYEGASMAALAAAAGLPKANLHYYFHNKAGLYRAVLDNILTTWISAADDIRPENDPAQALCRYIRDKIVLSQQRPYASKVFANEVLHGAGQLHAYFSTDMRRIFREKAAVIDHWIAQGLMDRVDSLHLLFAIWAMTQTYADFEAQIRPVLGIPRMTDDVYATGADLIVKLVLQGCGVRFVRAAGPGGG
ncbi:MAG: TetR family transcriptional regulator C-terminal domain-containing protein [Proteobacteria bacterium]|nr:TetR family transcriptional regulator C-terminal domain-containing protein [Pseudomonadota bacterium]